MVLVLIVVVAVLAVLAVAARPLDERLARHAQDRASAYLSAPLGQSATVRVHRRPFVTQALRGRYADVEVTGRLRVGELTDAALVAHLTNAYLPLRELLGRRARELPCKHIEARLLLPYDKLARAAHIPGLALTFDGERVLASAALTVPGVSDLARIHGEAQLRLTGDASVRLRIRGVSVAGIALPMIALDQLLPSMDVPILLPRLPYGIRLTEVRPTSGGVVVDGAADAVVLRPGGGAAAPLDTLQS